jgi:large subunit ribosomal protein LP1
MFINITNKMSWNQLSQTTHDQYACVFSTLLLHDDGQEVNEANLKKVISESGNTVAPYWPVLFLKAIAGKSVDSLLSVGGGSGSGSGPAPAQAKAAPAQGGKPAAPKEEEKPAEEENVSMGGLFD